VAPSPSAEDAGGVSEGSASTESPAAAETAAASNASGAAPPAQSAGSSKASAKSDPAWVSCGLPPKGKTTKDPAKGVAALANACAKVTKMKPVGKTITGKQGDAQTPQAFPLQAKANHCYRVYAQAADSIKDLDVAIKDSTGTIAGQDSSAGPTAVALDDGAVCFKENDDASVVVSVGSGSGAYALQIWGD
jgi:hypothetical protein